MRDPHYVVFDSACDIVGVRVKKIVARGFVTKDELTDVDELRLLSGKRAFAATCAPSNNNK